MNYQTNKIMYLQLILGIILPCKNEYSVVLFVVRISSNFAKISRSVSVSHLVRLVYLRREMDYLSCVFKSSGSSNNSAHVSNRLVSRVTTWEIDPVSWKLNWLYIFTYLEPLLDFLRNWIFNSKIVSQEQLRKFLS